VANAAVSESHRPSPHVGVVPGVVRSTASMLREPLEFITRISKEHGDVVKFRLAAREVYLFNHPDAIEDLVIGHKDLLVKDWLTRELSLVVGQGLLISEGALWKKQRKMIQPGFHRERIAKYADVMVRYTLRAIEQWKDGETRDVHLELMRLALEIVAQTLFGVEVGEASHRLEQASSVLTKRFSGIESKIPIGLPIPANRRARDAIAALDEITYGIIRARRESGDTGDLISMMLNAGDMDDRQLRDEAITLLVAGHETTAVSLGWSLYVLSRHPEIAAKLRAELDAVLDGRPATAEDVPKLRYTDWCVRESMRLYPPAWAIGREALEPMKIAGVPVKKGAQLWAAQWVVHRDPRWFPQPNAFRPERWENISIPKHAYFPFGGGPRICIGNAFAMMEMVLVLATIMQRFEFESVRDVRVVPSVTLRPKGGLPLRIKALARRETRTS
jgi:cytochrome P450